MESRLWSAALLAALLVGGGPLAGCRKKAEDKPTPSGEALKQSLAGVRQQLDDLKAKFMSMHKQVEAIPPDLPDFPDARARFFAAEEGRGITDAGATVLASRLDAALSSGNREELQLISTDLAGMSDSIRKLNELHLKMMHQMMAFERKARQLKETAPAPSPPTAAKSKRSKAKP
jgi:hypothetical protein